MQIVLAGQPTLADKLMKPSLEQFRQRLSSICSLKPFSADETIAYIQFRLERAEYSGSPLFNADALKKIAAASQGIPRIINNLCFNSLSLCCALNRKQVDGGMVDEAITDLDLIQKSSRLDTLLEDAARMPRRESSFATAPLRKILLAVAAALVLGVGAGMSSQFAHWHASPRLSADKRMLPPDESTFSMSPKSTSTRPAMIAPSHDEQGDFSNASRSSKRRELATSVNRQAPPSLKLVPVQVTIEPDQTLHDVTVRYLGTWDLKHLHQIRMLNPQLTNIDHIEANQKIWLPAPDADAARADIPSPITGSEP